MLKTQIAKFLSKIVIAHPFLEALFCFLVSKPGIRKHLKLGAIALSYAYSLQKPVIRRANLETYQMYVNIAEPMGIEAYFFKKNGVIPIVSSLIRKGDHCIDIGAHMGHYTFYMASKVGKKGRLLAFEPQPFYLKLLLDSIPLNGFKDSIEVSDAAVWNKTGDTLPFYLSTNPNNGGTSSLVNHGMYLSPEHTMQVHTTTLDDFVKARNLNHFRLVKIDVERAEWEVLQGMKNLLSHGSIDFIILEMHAGSESQRLLEGFGYRCFLLEKDRTIEMGQVEPGYFGDYLFQSPGVNLRQSPI